MCSKLAYQVLFLIGVTRDFFDTTPSFLRYVRDVCARDASTRVRMIAGSTDTRAIVWTMRSGGRVAHAGASHAYPDPRGIGTSEAGSLVESTHTFQGGGGYRYPFKRR